MWEYFLSVLYVHRLIDFTRVNWYSGLCVCFLFVFSLTRLNFAPTVTTCPTPSQSSGSANPVWVHLASVSCSASWTSPGQALVFEHWIVTVYADSPYLRIKYTLFILTYYLLPVEVPQTGRQTHPCIYCTHVLHTHTLFYQLVAGGGGGLYLPDMYFSFLGDKETMGSVHISKFVPWEKAVNLSGLKNIMLISLVMHTAEV